MKIYLNNNYITIICSFLIYCSLLFGFFFNENITSGAYWDYQGNKNLAERFIINFENAFFNYDAYNTRHSPIFWIIISGLKKLFQNDFFVRLFHLHLTLSLPIFFFLCLKEKFKKIDPNILFLFSLIILISPSYRSLAIWPDSRNLGLSIFILSIFFFIKFLNQKKFKFVLLNIFFFALSSYISPNFSVLSFYFLFRYFQHYKITKYSFWIIVLNLILVFPAFYYIFILDVNFLFKSALAGGDVDLKIWFNYFNKIFCISTILFFYLLPFYLTKLIKLDIKNILISKMEVILILILFAIGISLFNYKLSFGGGGIFFQISNILFGNLTFFYLIVLISIFSLINTFKVNNSNLLIYFLIIISNVQETIYHKYYDPLMIILYLTLFNFKIDKNNLNKKTVIIFYIFYLFLMSLYYLKRII